MQLDRKTKVKIVKIPMSRGARRATKRRQVELKGLLREVRYGQGDADQVTLVIQLDQGATLETLAKIVPAVLDAEGQIGKITVEWPVGKEA